MNSELIEELPEYLDGTNLEAITGTKAETWRYWIHIGQMPQGFPPSFKLGRRRLWRKTAVLAWLAEQELGGAQENVTAGAATG